MRVPQIFGVVLLVFCGVALAVGGSSKLLTPKTHPAEVTITYSPRENDRTDLRPIQSLLKDKQEVAPTLHVLFLALSLEVKENMGIATTEDIRKLNQSAVSRVLELKSWNQPAPGFSKLVSNSAGTGYLDTRLGLESRPLTPDLRTTASNALLDIAWACKEPLP